MNNEDKWGSQETWDVVVDGPMAPKELAELVAACEARPELWKRCALAFLEEQALREELRDLARGPMTSGSGLAGMSPSATALPCSTAGQTATAPSSLAARDNPHHAAEHGLANDKAEQLGRSSPAGQGPQSRKSARSTIWNNLALAASLMVTFAIGWQSSQRFGMRDQSAPQSTDPSRALVSGASPKTSVPAHEPVGSDLTPTENRLVSQPVGRSIDRETIDRVNAETLSKTLQVNLDEDLEPAVQQLRRRGYEVESQEGFVPIWMYDGSSAVIPYQQIKVRPKPAGQAY